MSEKMYPIPFASLMNWVVTEYAQSGDIFGVHKKYEATGKSLPIFGERIETPFGPAAGPNSQLAQNIIAAYFAGARFFEVKTVQKMDGADLAACVPRPCILAADEGYNQEWSTELTVAQAQDEYIKAWCALKVISKVYGLGDPDGFVFNMSVGYDLEGIKGRKVNSYIDNMMDASRTAQFKECKKVLAELFPAERDFIAHISPRVSRSVTVSTLHGCPPQEIERIASYLLTKKHLHTFVKCNPTILGYKTARSILDSMGYDYIVFDEHHFNEDLQWEDAVPMFERLQKLADKEGLEFGLKLSNTFPVDTTRGELPNDEMYMSGRSLFPLTIEMCNRISRAFGGKMRISFAGGAEYFNCDKLFAAGIWPITVATTILKPGGYNRLLQMVEKVEPMEYRAFAGTDSAAISDLAASARTNYHHLKPIKPLPSRKSTEQVPWLDCFIAPCKGGCPIEQDIPEYLELCRKGLYGPALKLITEKNALPFITGTICAHRCQGKCSRNFYEESVHIRDTKLLAAQKGYNALMASIKLPERVEGKRVAIIGGGPTGIAAAYFCGRAGIETTIFERERKLGGVPRYVIPAFRISDEAIDKDIALMLRYGVEVKCGKSAPSVAELKEMGYTHILLATGAWKAGKLDIEGNVQGVIEWMKKEKKQVKPNLSGNIVVVGAGNTAMDAARVAKRMGAHATILYRRTKKFMPADEHELQLAIDEGVEFIELAAPVKQAKGMLLCDKMVLGEPDTSGRRSPVKSGEQFSIPSCSPPSASRSIPTSWPQTASRWSARAPRLRPMSRACTARVTRTAAPRPWSRALPTPRASPKPWSARPTSMRSPRRPSSPSPTPSPSTASSRCPASARASAACSAPPSARTVWTPARTARTSPSSCPTRATRSSTSTRCATSAATARSSAPMPASPATTSSPSSRRRRIWRRARTPASSSSTPTTSASAWRRSATTISPPPTTICRWTSRR